VHTPKQQHNREPNWHYHPQSARYPLTPAWRNWLFDQGSLTERLIAASDDQFAVQLLSQNYAAPLVSERRCLQIPARQDALVRQVILTGRNAPWVFARSVIPVSTLTGANRHLKHWNSRPLGAMLFSNPSMRRGPIEIARLQPGNNLVPTEHQGQETLLGRRSVFYLNGKPLLVNEIFLPAFTPTEPV